MSTAVRRALYGKLAGDTTLTNMLASAPTGYTKAIFHAQAPEGASFPFVILNKQSGVPTQAFGLPSIFDTDVWLVKGVAQSTSADVAEQIQNRIATLLNDANLSISGGILLYLRRESDVDYSEVVDGDVYRHAGSLYRLVANI